MEGGFWVIRTLVSGKVVERSKFFAGRRRPRTRKKGSTSLAQKDRNMNTAVRQLARVANCNVDPTWKLVTLTYDDEHLPATAEEAWKVLSLFIRRLKRAGVSVNGFWITADKHKDGSAARLHHHMMIDGSGLDLVPVGEDLIPYAGARMLEHIWGNGFVHMEHAEDQSDYTPLAAYLVRQAADEPGKKKWRCSLGLKKPVVRSEDIVDREGEIHIPPGAEVSEISHYDEQTGSQYVRYVPKPADPSKRLYVGFDWLNGPYAREMLDGEEL